MVDTDVDPNAGGEPVKRKRGRPKGSGKKQQMREPLRDGMRDEDAGFVYKPEEEGSRLGIPAELIPDGMEYLWVTASVYGQPQPQRLARFQRQGWSPVPATRQGLDGMFMPKGHQGYIEVDGLVLHERSKKICDIARANEQRKALGQRKAKEAQLLGGDVGSTLDSRHPSALRTNKINRTYESIEIPED